MIQREQLLETDIAFATVRQAILLLRADVAMFEPRLSASIEKWRRGAILWVIGVGFAQAATILAVLRLFPGHP